MKGKRRQLFVIIVVAAVIVIAVMVYILYPDETNGMIDEEYPGTGTSDNATVIASGAFQDGAHDTSGTALMIDMKGELVLRFENFKTDDGPGLYVYLSVDLEDNDFVEVAKLRGTEGNMNYDVPAGTNTTKYNNVLIWCEPFGVLFGHAVLEP